MKLRQPLTGAAESLFAFAETIPVIDTHEHIPRSEAEYNRETIHFGNLFNPYVSNDLASAGMPFPKETSAAFHCVEDDWDAFEPYWNAVKHGSYARPIRIALWEFFGVDDFTRENYLEIVKKINEQNRPGVYKRIFQDKCNIEKCVRCGAILPDADDTLVMGNMKSPSVNLDENSIVKMSREVNVDSPKTLDGAIELFDAWMALRVSQGAIEFKSRAAPVQRADKKRAETAFRSMMSGGAVAPEDNLHLFVFVREANAKAAAKLGVPLALHTGVWADFRDLEVADLIGFIMRNPETRMDIYHLGIPNVRPAIQIVKNFPNAYLNLCWAHIVASDMVVNTLKEAIDMIPLNKVFAFGGDYILFIEKVYGHLVMARENIALALGDRVDRNLMDMSEAEQTLRSWFYDNPQAFYGI